jgi:hypothetical protein
LRDALKPAWNIGFAFIDLILFLGLGFDTPQGATVRDSGLTLVTTVVIIVA